MPSGQGLGFAIPSSMAKSVVSQLKEKGKVIRGWIGVTIQTVTPDLAKSFGMNVPKGALVSDVAPGGPAERGGVKRGDIIVTFDGRSVKDANSLSRIVAETPVGNEATVSVMRNGKEVSLRIRVEEMTEARLATQTQAQTPVQRFGMKVDGITPQWRQQFGIKDKSGVVVVGVEAGSIADEAGIQAGDVIQEVNHKPIRTIAEYNAAMGKAEQGKPVLMLLKRGKQTFFVTMESS